MRYFNTAGPCYPEAHYMLPAERRLPEAREYVDLGQYFVVHAPRQTGKTTTLAALARQLTAEGRFAAIRISCESAEPAADNYPRAEQNVLYRLADAAKYALEADLQPPSPWPDAADGNRLYAGLREWAAQCPRPLVLFFDEIDALQGQSMRTILRQLRDGHTDRPEPFPHSVALCGLRDIRDYKAASGGGQLRMGSPSPFNVSVDSLRLGDFDRDEVFELYGQHTAETGQVFEPEALDKAWELTQGQPWLVNALAWEVTFKMKVKPPEPITGEHMDVARERLILARATHLDSLVDKLNEDRVRRVIEPALAGGSVAEDETFDDDVAYVRDLGLIAPGNRVRIANPIYREVIVRVLTARTEASVTAEPRSFVLADGRFDMSRMLDEFVDFWRRHGDVLVDGSIYHEVAPQLVMMGFLHRIVNGGGHVEREFGVGRGRVDLHIQWPFTDADGKRQVQEEAIELKVWGPKQRDPLDDGLAQLDDYLAGLGLDHGVLVIFDRRPTAADIADRTAVSTTHTPSGRPVTLLRA